MPEPDIRVFEEYYSGLKSDRTSTSEAGPLVLDNDAAASLMEPTFESSVKDKNADENTNTTFGNDDIVGIDVFGDEKSTAENSEQVTANDESSTIMVDQIESAAVDGEESEVCTAEDISVSVEDQKEVAACQIDSQLLSSHIDSTSTSLENIEENAGDQQINAKTSEEQLSDVPVIADDDAQVPCKPEEVSPGSESKEAVAENNRTDDEQISEKPIDCDSLTSNTEQAKNTQSVSVINDCAENKTSSIDNASVEIAAVESDLVENAAGESDPVENAAGQSDPVENAAGESDPVENAADESDPVENTEGESDPVEDAAGESNPVESDPIESDPVENDPVENNPVDGSVVAKNNVSDDATEKTVEAAGNLIENQDCSNLVVDKPADSVPVEDKSDGPQNIEDIGGDSKIMGDTDLKEKQVDPENVEGTLVDPTLADVNEIDSTIMEDKEVDSTIVEDSQVDTTIVEDKQDDVAKVEESPIDITIDDDKPIQSSNALLDDSANVEEGAGDNSTLKRKQVVRRIAGTKKADFPFDDRFFGEQLADMENDAPILSTTAPSRLQLQTSSASWEEKTPTNNNRHSFGDETRYSLGNAPRFSVGSDQRYSLCSETRYSLCSDPGSVESSGSDLHRALLERIPSFQISVSGPEDETGHSSTSSHQDISTTKTPTNNPANLDTFPSPQMRIRRSFPRSRPVSGDPLSNYSVIPRRKDSYFPPHLLNYGEYYSDSEDDRSCSVTTSHHDESEESEEDYFSDMERQTANSLLFMAYEVKRRLSTVPAGAAGRYNLHKYVVEDSSSLMYEFSVAGGCDVTFHDDRMLDVSSLQDYVLEMLVMS